MTSYLDDFLKGSKCLLPFLYFFIAFNLIMFLCIPNGNPDTRNNNIKRDLKQIVNSIEQIIKGAIS